MPTWNELLDELQKHTDPIEGQKWLQNYPNDTIEKIRNSRKNTNIILYASAFLQKPQASANLLSITYEDINGFMSVMSGMDWSKGLTLILHTPGGITSAAETIVEYLHSKFEYIEVIVPTFAMSAGTMISLASDTIIMGRQSQLGPIDTQLNIGGRPVSARAIVDQFENAKNEILGDVRSAHIWAPILQSLGPALLQEARDQLEYGEKMVVRWLAKRMFKSHPDPFANGSKVAEYFNICDLNKNHGRRIDRNEAKSQDLIIENLEDDQAFQDAVLTLYHIITIIFEKTPASKIILSSEKRLWVKNLGIP